MGFYGSESCALHGKDDNSSDEVCDDIVIHLDSDGFLTCISENAERFGVDFGSLLLMPHIADFAEPEFASLVADYCAAVVTGEAQGERHDGWIEFPLSLFEPSSGEEGAADLEEAGRGGLQSARHGDHARVYCDRCTDCPGLAQ